MARMDSIKETYGASSGAQIVTGFLSAAKTWEGETARRVKGELRRMLNGVLR